MKGSVLFTINIGGLKLNNIKLAHGDGGRLTNKLINDLFYKYFSNDMLLQGLDSALVQCSSGKIAFTTDSFVLKPIFISGADIGKLSIFGTVNDLAVTGSTPLYLSSAFIIEEGFDMSVLETIVKSMANACSFSNVKIVTGDTKVVEKGSIDGIFINTSGIGIVNDGFFIKPPEPGDKIIISGSIAEHGATVAISRYNIKVQGEFKSDCYPLNLIVNKLYKYRKSIKIMKDPTRGGLATILNEISSKWRFNVKIMEAKIPLRNEVSYISELLGLDPLYLACEGRLLMVVENEICNEVINELRKIEECHDASIIGELINDRDGIVYLETELGGKRILNMLQGEMLPRIC